jgi:hypothetical protein
LSYIVKRVHLFHKSKSNPLEWNTVVDEDLSGDAINFNHSKGVGAVKDSFAFDLQDASRFFNPITRIVADDLVKIWVKRGSSSFTDEDIFIVGIINAIDYKNDTGSEIATIKGYDFSEVMFDFQVVPRYTNKTAPEIIRTILEEDPIKDRGITAGTIQELKNDGTPFPKKNLAGSYTFVFMLMEQLCSPLYTGDGQYYWYVDTSKKLHFKGKTATTETDGGADIIINGELMDINSISVKHNKEDVRNFIVYNCGMDLYGNGVEDVDYDAVSIAKFGFKYYFAVEETVHLFDELLQNEIEAYRLKGNLATTWGSDVVNVSTGAWVDGQTFPLPNNNPIAGGNQYTWVTLKENPGASPSVVVSSSNEEFNRHAAMLALQLGKHITQSMIREYSKPKYQLSVEIPFSSKFILGGNYLVSIPERGLNTSLRLMSQEISLETMQLAFEADKGTFEVTG